MRHSPKIETTHLSQQNAAVYTKLVNNKVFRVAGRAGLINPVHFDVKEGGMISLTDVALRLVNDTNKFKTHEQDTTLWLDEKAVELSRDLREILNAHGFWDQGHQSVKYLRDGLLHGRNMTPDNILEGLTKVMLGVKYDLDALDSVLGDVKECDDYLVPAIILRRLTTCSKALYVNYDTGKLTGRTLVAWSEVTDFITSPVRVAKFFGGISNGYHQLIKFRQKAIDNAQVPEDPASPEDFSDPNN
ncbi:hypothetical protein FLONG3_10102 [Fusarium longipes]|uniref:Uncharacterized protein n=1 Tax=Fusarium longipes TaxID=694270 RepID=A0A395RRW5_9HYPO|nr:hypothetical protein FLONG3_10102 [Fusarium longipes]